jgi:copper-binding protein NosD
MVNIKRVGLVLACVLSMAGVSAAAGHVKLLKQDWYAKAPALPKPTGEVVKVKTAAGLLKACAELKAGQTILLADGVYKMRKALGITKSNVALRGESGDRDKVVIDFQGYRKGIFISYCTDVTIADLTVMNIRQNGIKLNSNHKVDRVTIYNVVSRNVWQRHIKGVKVPDEDGKPSYIENCRVQYCLFYNDRPKRKGDDRGWDDKNPRKGYNYIAGMDIMGARGWIISDNVFVNIHGGTGSARGAIFMWHNTRDCVIERNIFIDCDSGIALGNSSARGERRHCTNMLVRNNFITRCPEKNIIMVHTRDSKVINNTVHDTTKKTSRLKRCFRAVFANDGLIVRNNIFSGPKIRLERIEGKIDVAGNLNKPVAEYFVDPAMGNLHLTDKAAEAIDKATASKDVPEDIDGAKRGDKPDLGADELNAPAKR